MVLIMIITWLAGKPSNDYIYVLQQTIDCLKEILEQLKEDEKYYLEEAAKRLEEAKVRHRANDRDVGLFLYKMKVWNDRAAQRVREYQISVNDSLVFGEKLKKEAMEVLRKEDHTAQKSTHVFIYFCFFLLVLYYFLSF